MSKEVSILVHLDIYQASYLFWGGKYSSKAIALLSDEKLIC